LAVAFARYERRINSLSVVAAGTVATGVFAAWSIYLLLPPRRPRGLARNLIVLYILTLTAPTFCLFILTWIGIAAGIH
jgi:hypothetical protein